MKACVLENIGQLVYKEVPQPEPKENEVLLHIRACGICSSDVDRVFKTGTYHFPTIPGHEFSGEIVKVGAKVSTELIGKHAVVFPLLPCKKCENCQEGQFQLCNDYSYFGSRCDGAYAEYLAVPEWNLVMFDNSVPFNIAALCEPASVAHHAAYSARIKKTDTVAVIGTGTIGIITALWAGRLTNEPVTIIGRNPKKGELIKELGLSYALQRDDVDEYNIVFECVGTSESLESAILHAKKRGTVICVGNPESDMSLSRKTYWKILRSELCLKGVWNSSYNDLENDWVETIRAMEKHEIDFSKLITHHFILADCAKAFETLRNPDIFTVKVMLTNDE